MQTEIMFAGFGGQGILMSGKLFAMTSMEQGYEVAWVPSYGPEMRGGTAYCTVVAGDGMIGSPIIKNPGNLVAMNQPSLEKFAPELKANGLVLVNSSLVKARADRGDVREFEVPATAIARELGNVKCANVVALASLITCMEMLDFNVFLDCIRKEFSKKPKMIPINIKAAEKGREAVA